MLKYHEPVRVLSKTMSLSRFVHQTKTAGHFRPPKVPRSMPGRKISETNRFRKILIRISGGLSQTGLLTEAETNRDRQDGDRQRQTDPQKYPDPGQAEKLTK